METCNRLKFQFWFLCVINYYENKLMWKLVVIVLGDKEGAWVQVDQELEFIYGNLEKTKKMLKTNQAKNI